MFLALTAKQCMLIEDVFKNTEKHKAKYETPEGLGGGCCDCPALSAHLCLQGSQAWLAVTVTQHQGAGWMGEGRRP